MIGEELFEAEEKMVKAVSVAKEDFSTIRTGRATPQMFSKILVDYYGAPTPIQQLASFQTPEARMILISPFDHGAMHNIEKAIRDSDLGVNPVDDGKVIRVEVSVSDDFDTPGRASITASEATLEAIAGAVDQAWEDAEADRDANQTFEGFSILRHPEDAWVETYLVNTGWSEDLSPPGDNYHCWGWQHDVADDSVGVPHPDIPVETVTAFEKFANDWAFGRSKTHSLRIGDWEIVAWRKELPEREDPNDWVGMGWVGSDGRP